MSAQAPIENTLRAAAGPVAERARTPLAVVPTPSPRSGPGVLVLCALALLAALVMVLVMNITLSNRQYALLDLRAQQQELIEANERLAEQVGYLEAPQNLAARADSLGMVTSGGTASLDVASGEVTRRPDGGVPAGLSATHVAPPASADGARRGESAQGGAELPGPRTASESAPSRTADEPAPPQNSEAGSAGSDSAGH